MKVISIFLAVFLLLAAIGGCSCDNSDYYSTPDVTVTAPPTEASAPPLEEGEYTMCCSFMQTALYMYGQDVIMETEWDMKSWYDFASEITEEGLTLRFTIARRSYVYSYNGTESVIFDTADDSTKSADTEMYFDIIGYGFTVDFDKAGNILSVGGTERLYSEVKGSEYLLGEAEIRAVAQELLLKIPDTVTKDTVITHSQAVDAETDMEMKYSVSRISRTQLSFDMSPVSEYGLPETEVGDGYTVEYTGAADYSGSLSIMSSDRFLQSSSNRITYYSVMEVIPDGSEPYTLDGVTTVTDKCEVNRKVS